MTIIDTKIIAARFLLLEDYRSLHARQSEIVDVVNGK